MSLVGEMFCALGNPRAVMKRQLDAQPGEERILFYAMLAAVIGSVAVLPETVFLAAQAGSGPDELGPLTFTTLVFRVIVGVLFLYAVAMVGRWIAKLFKGQGTGRDARLALFWSMLVIAPLELIAGGMFAVGLVMGFVPLLGWAGTVSGAAKLVLLWVWGHSFAEAEGFVSGLRTMIVIAAVCAFVLAAVYVFIPQAAIAG